MKKYALPKRTQEHADHETFGCAVADRVLCLTGRDKKPLNVKWYEPSLLSLIEMTARRVIMQAKEVGEVSIKRCGKDQSTCRTKKDEIKRENT